MTTFRTVPSNATASVLTSFLDRHGKVRGSDEIPLCACGYRGADPDYQHIYRDMHTHGLLVVPAHMFAASVKAVTADMTIACGGSSSAAVDNTSGQRAGER